MKRNIKIAVIALILGFALTAFVQAQERQYYVGSAKSNKYHYTWCKWAKRIKQENLVVFHSIKEAQATIGHQQTVNSPRVNKEHFIL